MRAAITIEGVLLSIVFAVGLTWAESSNVQLVEADEDATAIELLWEPASYDRPTSDEFTMLEAVSECSQTRLRGIDVTLGWLVQRLRVTAHRVDISMFSDGFAKGRYVTTGERPVAENRLLYNGALPGVYYYWRVLTKTPEGWIVSGTGRFETPVCPIDEVPE